MSNPSLNDFHNMASTARELDKHAPKAEMLASFSVLAFFCNELLYRLKGY